MWVVFSDIVNCFEFSVVNSYDGICKYIEFMVY